MHALLLAAWREANWFSVGRYVVMPDHVHLFCSPAVNPPEPLVRWTTYWKSLVARRSPDGEGARLWQRNIWDVQLRRGEDYGEKWHYVFHNPVRAGLVDRPEAWPYHGELETLRWHD